MEYRTLGRTGWKVSAIGFGAWALGGEWGQTDDSEGLRALHTAVDLGVNFIDTAQKYGGGHGEEVVGKFLKECPEELLVATKVPLKDESVWPPTDDLDIMDLFPPDWIIGECEKSLRRLGREVIDLYQLHTWTESWNYRDEWYDAMETLTKDGKIRAWGISASEPRPEDVIGAVSQIRVDSIQVIYNIFEQRTRDSVIAACADKNVAVINRVALDEGSLTGKFTEKTQFGKGDFRKHFFRGNNLKATIKHVKEVGELKNKRHPDMPMYEYAFRFCLSEPRNSTVLAGIRTVDQAKMNCAVGDGPFLDAEELEELKSLAWIREFWSEEVEDE